MHEPLEKPDIFRVLIIDDQVCSGRDTISASAFQEGISAYITYLIAGRIQNVDVCFAGTPEDGVNRWKNEIFDLTLVDSDLKSSASTPKDKTEIQSFLDIIPSLKGAYIFRLLWDLMNDEMDDNPYKAYRDGCRVVFWTGLRTINDDGRQNKLEKILAPCFKSSHWFIPKREDDNECQWADVLDKDNNSSSVTTLENCIQKSMINFDSTISWRSLLARYITLYRVKSPSDFQFITDFSGWVKQGYLYVENGSVFFSDSRPDGKVKYVELSPRLRYGNPSFKAIIDDRQGISYDDSIPMDTWCFPNESKKNVHSSTIIAAATPLTGCSAVGKDHAIDLMADKVAALLNGPFDQVVLKTVYLDSLEQWDNLHWPTLQAQSHHRTRCLRSIGHPRTLWNTGITALESFTPEMMHLFLLNFAKNDVEKRKNTIVSLGSKFPQWDLNVRREKLPPKRYRTRPLDFCKGSREFQRDVKKIWLTLFKEVFMRLKKQYYPFVEINVRHYLRECIAFHLGGHEYLSPAKIDPDESKKETDFTRRYDTLDQEFGIWLSVLDDVAKHYNKKLLLKLPFRGDILHFIRLIRDYAKGRREKGDSTSIQGITLINAFKSGVGETTATGMFTPAWYGNPEAWGDAHGRQWTYQMSGENVSASRNELLGEVFRLVANSNLEVHISGGIVDVKGIRYCSPAIVRKEVCRGCGICFNECKSSAIKLVGELPSRKAEISSLACKSCGKCVHECPWGAIIRPKVQIGTWALMDLNLSEPHWNACPKTPPAIGVGKPHVDVNKCQCLTCSVKCKHNALKKKGDAFAQIDYGLCVDCKECVDQCVHGAVVVGESANSTNSHAMEFDEKAKRRINPRIAFCLHELCNGCGKCSRTFYCDTFMDRRGLALPPVMDSRNCTGCGLCVQTCPRGAIQLFDPKHVVALIGTGDSLTTWHRRLTAYEIPHLVFREDEVKKYYEKWEEKSSAQQMEEIWKYRKEHDLFFDKMSRDDYTDARDWKVFARSVLEKMVLDDDIIQKWLFLAWSDPGQVLKDSPIIHAIGLDNCCYFENSLDCPDCGLRFSFKKVLTRNGMMKIVADVNERLKNLREVR